MLFVNYVGILFCNESEVSLVEKEDDAEFDQFDENKYYTSHHPQVKTGHVGNTWYRPRTGGELLVHK